MSRTITLLAALGVLGGLAAGVLWPTLARPPHTVVIDKPQGYFYRLTAKFTVKATAEPIDFDVVVACNLRYTRSRLTGRSDDSQTTPIWVLKVTSGGSGVVLLTPRLCYTAGDPKPINAFVPPDYLPRITWYDDANDMRFGLAYMSEDAYDNPLGKLKFHGAAIVPANADDWLAWRQRAEAEYTPRDNWPGPWGMDSSSRENFKDHVGDKCAMWERIKLPEKLREMVRAKWPASRPRFWGVHKNFPPQPGDEELGKLAHNMQNITVEFRPGDSSTLHHRYLFNFTQGMLPLRSGRQSGSMAHTAPGKVHGHFDAEFYPEVRYPTRGDAVPERRTIRIDFGNGAMKGFAACQILEGRQKQEPPRPWREYRELTDYFLDGLPLGTWHGHGSPIALFERDEYYWRINGNL